MRISGENLNFALFGTAVSLEADFLISIWGLMCNLLPKWSHFEGVITWNASLWLLCWIKLHVDCYHCSINLYDTSHVSTFSYRFLCFAFILAALTNVSCAVNFYVFGFRLHCKFVCLKPYMIVALLYEIVLLCWWITITSSLVSVCVHVCVGKHVFDPCPRDATFKLFHFLKQQTERGVRFVAFNSWSYIASEQHTLCIPGKLEFQTVACFDFLESKSFQMCKLKMMAFFSVHGKCRWLFLCLLEAARGKYPCSSPTPQFCHVW